MDTDADFSSLPNSFAMSIALSAESGNAWIVNASGNWVPYTGPIEKELGLIENAAY